MEGGQGPGSTQRARATPKPGSPPNARRTEGFGSASMRRGDISGPAACGLAVHPAGSHATAVSPAPETDNVLLFLLNSSRFSHRGRWCFRAADRNGSSGRVPHRAGWPKEPPRGRRSQAHTLHLCKVPRTGDFTSLSPGAPAGCVVHRQRAAKVETLNTSWRRGRLQQPAVLLAWPSLRQLAEQGRQDGRYHHVSRKMCKTEDTQIQDLTKNPRWGLQSTTQIHQGILLQNRRLLTLDHHKPDSRPSITKQRRKSCGKMMQRKHHAR